MQGIAVQGVGIGDLADRTDLGKPKTLAEAAQQFEALLLNQLLQSANNPESGGWFGTGEADQAGLQALQLAQQQFAELLAARGGLGLAALITGRMADAEYSTPTEPNREIAKQLTDSTT
jgi:flagellar protein FlgJ